MKTILSALIATFWAAFSLNAGTLYFESFGGDTTDLNGTTPNTVGTAAPEVPDGASWSSGSENATIWTTGGGIPTDNGVAALPIDTLQTSTQYTMALTLDYAAGAVGDGWITLGLSSGTANLDTNFAGAAHGEATLALRPNGDWSFWSGNKTGGQSASGGGIVLGNNIEIETMFTTGTTLDAAPADYSISITGSDSATTLLSLPDTGFNDVSTYTRFMMSTTNEQDIQLQSFEVAAVPEASTYTLLLGAFSIGFVMLKRNRRQ